MKEGREEKRKYGEGGGSEGCGRREKKRREEVNR